MKKLSYLLTIVFAMLVLSCKEQKSEKFILLTSHIWTTDSLLANGVDASDPGEFLGNLKGDAKFREDGTGYFGKYVGNWSFSPDEKKLTIATDSLPMPVTCDIVELTTLSLKIKSTVLNPKNLLETVNIRMTFKSK